MRSRRLAAAVIAGIGVILGAAGTAQAGTAFGTDGYSSCSTTLSTTVASGFVDTTDTYTKSLNSMTINSSYSTAKYWACNAAGTPIRVGRITGTNRYAFTGVAVNGCTAGYPGGFSCSAGGGSSVLNDSTPTVCTICSDLSFNQIGLKVTWQSGVITHYSHQASALFQQRSTATPTGNTIRLYSNVDVSAL
jgi:hypothetical protein